MKKTREKPEEETTVHAKHTSIKLYLLLYLTYSYSGVTRAAGGAPSCRNGAVVAARLPPQAAPWKCGVEKEEGEKKVKWKKERTLKAESWRLKGGHSQIERKASLSWRSLSVQAWREAERNTETGWEIKPHIEGITSMWHGEYAISAEAGYLWKYYIKLLVAKLARRNIHRHCEI